MPTSTEAFHRLMLFLCNGIGPKTTRDLLAKFTSAQAVFEASKKEVLCIPRISENIFEQLHQKSLLNQAERELHFTQQAGIEILFLGDEKYPKRLAECTDAPPILFYKGNASLNPTRAIAIVGTRNMSAYGQRVTEELIDDLKQDEGVLIISGLAAGIDAIAHKTAVKNQLSTVGVLGHGLDRIYPNEHKNLAAQMINNGGLLTEFTKGTLPDRSNFPMRNRIVAGMCDVVILSESKTRGGAMITAYLAAGYNREVATFPGRTTDSRSAGCNYLIKKNVAALIESTDDLRELMNWKEKGKKAPKQLQILLSSEAQKVWDNLQNQDSLHVDLLAVNTAMSPSQLSATLLEMEMDGLVKSLPGKRYCLA